MLTEFPVLQAATSGCPGAAYVDLPSNVLMAPAEGAGDHASLLHVPQPGEDPAGGLSGRPQADGADVARAKQLLSKAKRSELFTGCKCA